MWDSVTGDLLPREQARLVELLAKLAPPGRRKGKRRHGPTDTKKRAAGVAALAGGKR